MTNLKDFLDSLPAPFGRSKTRRNEAVADARRKLASYRNSHDLPQSTRVMQLLWAESFIQTALYHETQGRLGYNDQRPSGILAQQLRLRGEN